MKTAIGLVDEGLRLAQQVETLAANANGGPSVGGWNDGVMMAVQEWENDVSTYVDALILSRQDLDVERELMELANAVCELRIQVCKLPTWLR